MQKGKACGPHNLCAEHLIYAHPSIVVHLKWLFHMILKHSFVPSSFGYGVSIIGAGAIELAGAHAPQISDSGGIGGTTEFMGHL